MPELPEIESLCRELRPRILGRRLLGARVSQPKAVNVAPEELSRQVYGQVVEEVYRRGKHLVVALPGGALWLHLGLTGQVTIRRAGQSQQDSKVVVAFALDDGSELRLERAFMGQAHFLSRSESQQREQQLGLEPLSPEFTAATLQQLAAARPRWPLKVFLTEQEVIAGLGNTYGDEILFRARLHPARPLSTLSPAEWQAVQQATQEVIAEAIELGGQPDYVGLEGRPGRYANRVHGREICPACGSLLEKLTLRGRTTYFCPRCQPAQ